MRRYPLQRTSTHVQALADKWDHGRLLAQGDGTFASTGGSGDAGESRGRRRGGGDGHRRLRERILGRWVWDRTDRRRQRHRDPRRRVGVDHRSSRRPVRADLRRSPGLLRHGQRPRRRVRAQDQVGGQARRHNGCDPQRVASSRPGGAAPCVRRHPGGGAHLPRRQVPGRPQHPDIRLAHQSRVVVGPQPLRPGRLLHRLHRGKHLLRLPRQEHRCQAGGDLRLQRQPVA